MAVGARGECRFTVESANGEQEERTLLFTNAALMTAERELGTTFPGIIRQLEATNLSLTNCRTLIRIGLETARRENHEARGSYTDADAQSLLDQVGYFNMVVGLTAAIYMVFNFGRNLKKEKPKDDDNPPA